MEGKRKNIKTVIPLINPLMAIGEFTIFEEPVVEVRESKRPATLPVINRARKKKMPRYM